MPGWSGAFNTEGAEKRWQEDRGPSWEGAEGVRSWEGKHGGQTEVWATFGAGPGWSARYMRKASMLFVTCQASLLMSTVRMSLGAGKEGRGGKGSGEKEMGGKRMAREMR